ncbi:MAG: endonuclease IV [Desulfurococcales archaeon ex4484_58]|nr:MAG: endonuclease IV [Desulfurococcales archaeon ex4484_58]
MARLRFGPAGKPVSMKSSDLLKAPSFLREIGLDAMEYEAVRGVKISEEKARKFGEEAKKNDILLSMHAPYFINLASSKESTVEASIKRLEESVKASMWMDSYIVVFHPGYYKDAPSKKEAVDRVVENLKPVIEYRDSIGANNVWLGVETTGKITQVGDLDETIYISKKLEGVKPVIDWAHLYARYEGKYVKSVDDVLEVIEKLEKELGEESIKPLHTHFSKIEYGKGGEKKHHNLSEKDYGPEFEHVCRAYSETGIEAVIISESPVLELDALVMKKICIEICGAKCFAD